MGRRAGRHSAARTRRGAEGRRCVVNSSRRAESKNDDCGRYWRVLQSRLFIYAPKIALLLDMQKTLLKKMGKKMKKLPKFLSKLREPEKVETMGRTARRRQGVFFGRLGVPERSGAGAAGSGRCAVGVFFGEGGGRAVGRARSEGSMRRRVPTGEPPRGVFFSGVRRGARQGRCGRPRGAAARSTRLGRLCGH